MSLHWGTLPMHPHPPLLPVIMGSTKLCKCKLSARSRRRILFTLLISNNLSPFLYPGLTCNFQEVQPTAFRSFSSQMGAVWGPGYHAAQSTPAKAHLGE